ncbi:MAG: hypothetical protein KJ066_19425 [Acidobacteria bacterium]|nr:hypothetical protein [Acidobacteriota bacterium]
MSGRYFSRRHYQLVSPTADTAAVISARRSWHEAGRRGRADCEARYPVITADNALEAITYQAERIAFHYHQIESCAS